MLKGDFDFARAGPCFMKIAWQVFRNESRAETHQRFYMIEVHRHRFEMSARKVPFEKCTRWQKICGRSAEDQIGDSIYSFFYDFERKKRRAKDARKTYPLEPCPAQNGLRLAMPDIGPR